ncbi:DUF6377 domain-containing protein [Bacteroides sp.]|uniref:DUF6377 domain-containing protein n=1 Tax=Bacteroides sp. TaxID=29523 RepID=UPI00260E4DE1|nr:DUF6377 domain-containing protein [Bacteroides sp.]
MKSSFILIILLLCLPFATIHSIGKNDRNTLQVKENLDSLDKYILHTDIYKKQKEERISVLSERLKDTGLSLDEQYRYTYLLFDEYSTYQSKLMYTSANRLIELSSRMNDKNKVVDSEIQLAYSYLWCGAFKEAYEYANTIDTVGTTNHTKVYYLMFRLNLEYESALYVKPLHFFLQNYNNSMCRIINQLEKLLPADDDHLLEARQKACSHNNQFKQAYEYLQQRLKHSSGVSREMSAKLGDVGFYHLEMGDTVTAIQYMVKSAIMDIQIGSKQAPALRKIAEAIYPDGEVERAYKYIQLSMENAVFFDSRYRMYESSITLPLIDKDLYELTKKQKDTLAITVCFIILFIITLFISFLFIWKQNKKLKSSALLIQDQNMSLLSMNARMTEINKELQDANNIKATYLGRILSDNSSSISAMEELVKVVRIKIKAKQFDDIIQFIYKHDYLKKRKDMLARFDEMFLKLFPNFIEKFNSLLKEEDRVIVQEKNMLTPELRIFALVRLGVTKSDTIAEILDFSASTVRNYKTKIRNISIVPNEEFDKCLLEIESEP